MSTNFYASLWFLPAALLSFCPGYRVFSFSLSFSVLDVFSEYRKTKLLSWLHFFWCLFVNANYLVFSIESSCRGGTPMKWWWLSGHSQSMLFPLKNRSYYSSKDVSPAKQLFLLELKFTQLWPMIRVINQMWAKARVTLKRGCWNALSKRGEE